MFNSSSVASLGVIVLVFYSKRPRGVIRVVFGSPAAAMDGWPRVQ